MVVIRFSELRQRSPVDGTSDDHLVGEVVFDVVADGQVVAADQRALVKTSAGASSIDQLKVALARDYSGPRLRFDEFSACVEGNYRKLIPPIPSNAINWVQQSNLYQVPAECNCGLAGDSAAW